MAIKIVKPRKPKKAAAAPAKKPAAVVAPEPVVEPEPVVAAQPAQPAGEAAAPIVEAPVDNRRHAQGGGRSRGHSLGGRARRSK
jgi:hypothetical protein